MISRILTGVVGLGIIGYGLTAGNQTVGLEAGGGAQLLLLGIGAFLLLLAVTGRRLTPRKLVRGYQQIAVLLLNTVLLVAVLELLVIISFNAQLVVRNERVIVVDGELEVYRAAAWLPTYLAEIEQAAEYRYSPYDLWTSQPFSGETIQIGADGRRVVPGAACEPGAYRIDLYGGSTMWGMGAPDSGTIPAYLQVALAAEPGTAGRAICVRNQAELGFVSTQEVVRLLLQLQHGDQPDVAIFYDGVNDAVAAYNTGTAGMHRNSGTFTGAFATQGESPLVEWLLASNLVRFARGLVAQSSPVATAPVDYPTLAGEAVDIYLNNVRMVNALAAEYNFNVVFLWQPITVAENKPLTREEEGMVKVIPPELLTVYQTAWAEVKTRAQSGDIPHLYYIADALDGVEAPLYFDHHHLAPPGNEIVAARIMDIISPSILKGFSEG